MRCLRVLALAAETTLAVCLLAGCQPPPKPVPGPQREPSPGRQPVPRTERESLDPASGTPGRRVGGGGGFDYYLLTLSWSPEYCYSHRGAAQCQAHSTFVLHGLWPENRDGSYPEDCPDGGTGALPAESPYPDARLAQHEWRAHGTCSGMGPDAYFRTAAEAFRSVKIPAQFQQMSGPVTLSPEKIAGLFQESNPGLPQGSTTVECRNGYLDAVEICMDKGLHAVACGQGLHGCNAGSVRVPAP